MALRVSKTGATGHVSFVLRKYTSGHPPVLFLSNILFSTYRDAWFNSCSVHWFMPAGKKQVLIDRINEMLDHYLSQQQARQEGGATGEDGSGDEDAETEFPVGDAEEVDFLGDLEEGNR